MDLVYFIPAGTAIIMQSAFTSMSDVIRHKAVAQMFPIDQLLTERFDSRSKVRSLHVPVLFLHGSNDSVVPAEMSQQLYAAAPEPKQLLLISGAEHVKIYQPGDQSYLRAIQRFVELLERGRMTNEPAMQPNHHDRERHQQSGNSF
jgi:fermentation-respiration switch protein FrsA (DUF1100 family)